MSDLTHGLVVCAIMSACSLVLGTNATAQEQLSPQGVMVQVHADRADALYKCRETATFVATVKDNRLPVVAGEVTVTLTLDQGKVIEQKTLKLEGTGPVKVTGTLKKPGFLNCKVEFTKDGKVFKGAAAAGYEPTKIKTACKKPADFDAFWRKGLKELAKIPADVKITPLPEMSDKDQDTFQISFANVDNTRIYGFLCIPKNRKPPYPAVVHIPSAGLIKPVKPIDPKWAQRGAIYLNMCVHDFDPLHPPAEISKRSDYSLLGAPDREKYYFRRAILGIDRAIDYIASRPDFDGKHLVVYGDSQGGGLSLIEGGLNSHVTAISVTKPALCDHQGDLLGRKSTWPRFLANAPKDQVKKWAKMSEYFDAVNFVRKIKAPTLFCLGFIDSFVPPSTVYAAYNVVRAPKYANNLPLLEHMGWPKNDAAADSWLKFEDTWMEGQLGLGPVVGFPGTGKVKSGGK